VSEVRRSVGLLATLVAGVTIGAIEAVLAISFAALVFGGYLSQFLADGIGLYLAAAALTLAILAWRAGSRGVVGSVQDAAAAVLAIVAADTALDAIGSAAPITVPTMRPPASAAPTKSTPSTARSAMYPPIGKLTRIATGQNHIRRAVLVQSPCLSITVPPCGMPVFPTTRTVSPAGPGWS
jgi:hypothetical protein